jgi:aspartyl-tRNA(Asn)/glutamyl-tRNA(Gln) amidotransferase subunit A
MYSWKSITAIADDVQSGSVTAVSNVETALKYIAELDSEYQAIIAVIKDRSIKRAELIDADIKAGNKAGRLAGVPFIAKDNFLVFGADTTAASNILRGFEAPYQSTAVERLEAEGAICVAKANLDAFAHGGSTENSDFFTTKNAHDKTRVPGGSSGGSATAVALGLVPFALGSDTGGSIRQPASYSGVVGFKPTYGLVSRSGVIAMASSTDTIGPLTRTVEDAALVMDVMSGKDSLDSTTIERDISPYTDLTLKPSGKKIGIIKEYFGDGLDPGVKDTVTAALKKMEQAGAVLVDISLPSLSLALAAYYIIVPAEISSNLSRYDGQRFHHSAKDTKSLDESYTKTRSEGFGPEAKRRIMIGTHVLSSGYYDAYYKKAQTVRAKIIQEFNDAFKEVDFMAGPVAPTTAFKIGENAEDPMAMYLQDIMTVAISLAGLPAISVPCGIVNGLPVGLQLIAPQKADRTLLGLARSYQEIYS